MRQQIGLGRTFVDSGRPLQANQAFEAFEGEFDAPLETIKCEDIGRGEELAHTTA